MQEVCDQELHGAHLEQFNARLQGQLQALAARSANGRTMRDASIKALSDELVRYRSLLQTAMGPSADAGKAAWQELQLESRKEALNLPAMPPSLALRAARQEDTTAASRPRRAAAEERQQHSAGAARDYKVWRDWSGGLQPARPRNEVVAHTALASPSPPARR